MISRLQNPWDDKLTEAEASIVDGAPGVAREIVLAAINDLATIGFTLAEVSRLCRILYSSGDPDLSLMFADAAIAASENESFQAAETNRFDVGKLHLMKAMCEDFFDNNAVAIDSYRQAVRGFNQGKEVADPAVMAYKTEARARLGEALSSIGNYIGAEHELRAALAATHGESSNLSLRLTICSMLANVLSNMGLYDYADDFFDRALVGLEAEKMWVDLARAHTHHTLHLIRCHEKIRARHFRGQERLSPLDALERAFEGAVRGCLYMESLRLTFQAAPDRKKWELFTSEGWSATFLAANLLRRAGVVTELIEARVNATRHGFTLDSGQAETHKVPAPQDRQPRFGTADIFPTNGSSMLLGGAYLPGHRPPPLLMPTSDAKKPRLALAAFLDMDPYPGRQPRTPPVHTW